MTRNVAPGVSSSVAKPIKVVDDEGRVRSASGTYGIRREEAWQDGNGRVVRYDLAFIHRGVCSVDSGRMFGYGNAHGAPERHWMGVGGGAFLKAERNLLENHGWTYNPSTTSWNTSSRWH